MLGDHVRRVLDRVACLLIGAGPFQNMGGEHVSDIVRSIGKKARDDSAAVVGIADALALDRHPRGFIEGRLIVGGVLDFHGLHEQRARVFLAGEEYAAMPVDIRVEVLWISGRIRRKGFEPKKDGLAFLKAFDGTSTSSPTAGFSLVKSLHTD